MIELKKFLVIIGVWGHINHCLISLSVCVCVSFFLPFFLLSCYFSFLREFQDRKGGIPGGRSQEGRG